MNDYPGTETEIVFDNNNRKDKPIKSKYFSDPIVVTNILGEHVGYSWNYGDSVELVVNMQETVLRADAEHVEEFEIYLQGKEIEMNFINMRGDVCYTFYLPAALTTKIRLNDCEDRLIDKNTYTCTLVLVNPYDFSRINLLKDPYKIYVK